VPDPFNDLPDNAAPRLSTEALLDFDGYGVGYHAELGSLPPQAVDMLTVRIEQLTVEGLSPSKIRGLAGRS
jgi:hypothetical protein